MGNFMLKTSPLRIFLLLIVIIVTALSAYNSIYVQNYKELKREYDILISNDFDVSYIKDGYFESYSLEEMESGLVQQMSVKRAKIDGEIMRSDYFLCKKSGWGIYFINSITTSGYCTGVYINKHDKAGLVDEKCLEKYDEQSCRFGGYIL